MVCLWCGRTVARSLGHVITKFSGVGRLICPWCSAGALRARSSAITPLLRALHWLPVAYQIVLLKFYFSTFKAIDKLAPTYISELVSLKGTGRRYYLRSNDGKLLNIPSCKSLFTLGDRFLCMFAP